MTGLGPAVLVVAWRAALQAFSPLHQVDVTLPTVQTVSVTTTPALATRGVTSFAKHGGGVAKVTEKERGYLLSLWCSLMKTKRRLCVYVCSSNLSEQVSTQLLPCLKNPDLQSTHCTL